MYKEVLRSIDGVTILPQASLIIFGVFFIGMIIIVATMRRSDVNKMKNMPLEDGAEKPDNSFNFGS